MPQLVALVVEDDADLAALYARALQEAQFKTHVVRDGSQVLEQIQALRPALVLLDLYLPRMNGVEILRAMRVNPDFAAIRVIVSTADSAMASAAHEGADLVLIKPVSYSQLSELAARFHAEASAGTSDTV
jgi:chemosensory pili system protein ChpA (sensor histidine kinase/response regulator)